MASRTEGLRLPYWAYICLVLPVCFALPLATPEEPYPFINECKEYEQNCTVFVQSPISITCIASRYFPDIELMFLHGVQKVLTLDTVEWTNDDGTKSKLIITTAAPSKIPYVCMAFNIPGSQDERTATISVFDHHGNITSGETTENPYYKIGLSVGASALCVAILVIIFTKKRGRRENGTAEECSAILATQRDEKGDVSRKVSEETMEHIIWNIGGIGKVNLFLSQLIPDRKPIAANEKMKRVVEVAVRELIAWSNESVGLNPVVLMSLALEDAGFSSVEKLLFSVPDELMTTIEDDKLTDFTDKLTGRHCKRLAMTLNISKQKTDELILGNNHYIFNTRALITGWLREVECSNYEKRCRLDDAVIKIGRYDLQDFFKTLVDRSNAEQRGVKSHYFDHESIFDDDIPQLVKLVKWLPPDKKTQLQKKIGLPAEKDDDDDALKDRIKEWRDNITITSSDKVSRGQALKEFRSLRKELTNNTKYTELTLTDEEIKAVSSLVTSTDKQQELASRLNIDAVHGQTGSFVGQLKQWRNTQAKKNCRDTLLKALKKIGLTEITVSKRTTKQLEQEELSHIAHNLMMEDVRPIINVLSIDKEIVQSYIQQWNNQGNCTTGHLVNIKKQIRNREDFCKALRNIGFVDIARSVYFDEIVL